jgi:hypothetical protein
MDLPLDILRLILLNSKINNIKNLSLVDKTFNNLCNEKTLWLFKFAEKNLQVINNEVVNIKQYLNEYKKVSYATYITDCLVNMIECEKFNIPLHVCRFKLYFSIDKLTKILNKDNPVFNLYKDNDNMEIDICFEEKGKIHYMSCSDMYDRGTSKYAEKIEKIGLYFVKSLINKILYYYTLSEIRDIEYIKDYNGIPLVISEYNLDEYNMWFKNLHPERAEYWKECYSKYESLYF